jgi:uncharacterized RDD family membrane protein YckC
LQFEPAREYKTQNLRLSAAALPNTILFVIPLMIIRICFCGARRPASHHHPFRFFAGRCIKSCSSCKQERTMFCSHCGAKLPDGDRICATCGREVRGASALEPVPDQSQDATGTERPEAPGRESVQSDPQVRPWVRFSARILDVTLFTLPVNLLIALFFPNAFIARGSEHILGVVLLFSWAFVEAGLLSTFGTTPGKALLNVRLESASGYGLTYSDALSRSIKVWWRGLGTGFTIVSFVTAIVAYYNLTHNFRTSWDAEGGFIVQHGRVGPVRILSAMAIFCLLFLLYSLNLWWLGRR